MNEARLAAILDAYGAAPAHWPADERAAAEALLARSPGARRLQRAAAGLDLVLARHEPLRPTPALRAAILADAPRRQAAAERAGPSGFWAALLQELGGWRPAGAALAAALVLGIMAGGLVEPQVAPPAAGDLMHLALLDGQDIGDY